MRWEWFISYTYMRLHTGCLCALRWGGRGHWCCDITWERVGNSVLPQVWMHRVTYMYETGSSWAGASRLGTVINLPENKYGVTATNNQKKGSWACIWMNRWAFGPLHQGIAMIPQKTNGVTIHCCPHTHTQKGILAHSWICQWAHGLICEGTTNLQSKKDEATVPIKTARIYMYIYIKILYGDIYQWVHELPSRCINGPPGAPVTTMATLIWKKHAYRALFLVWWTNTNGSIGHGESLRMPIQEGLIYGKRPTKANCVEETKPTKESCVWRVGNSTERDILPDVYHQKNTLVT